MSLRLLHRPLPNRFAIGVVGGCLLSCSLSLATLLAGSSRPAQDAAAAVAYPPQPVPRRLLVVRGAAGDPEYATAFAEWTERWQAIAAANGIPIQTIGTPPADPAGADHDAPQPALAPDSKTPSPSPEPSDREQLRAALQQAAAAPPAEFWLVLIGHGSADGQNAKFNLRGPDVSAAELGEWLQPLQPSRALVVLDCSSASGGFVPVLSGPRRVVVTGTRSGSERNFSRFGQYLAAAIDDPASDLDKDGQTTLLEAFLAASQRTAEFYRDAARLVTEHPLLDDNGDRRGTDAAWFQGIRVARTPRAGEQVDGRLAQSLTLRPSAAEQNWDPQRLAERDALEAQIERLVASKSELNPDDYYRQLERLLVPLARLYHPAPPAALPEK